MLKGCKTFEHLKSLMNRKIDKKVLLNEKIYDIILQVDEPGATVKCNDPTTTAAPTTAPPSTTQAPATTTKAPEATTTDSGY